MSVLTLNITIDSSETDGNPATWEWTTSTGESGNNPPPRMSINDTLTIVVTDNNPNNTAPLDGFMIMGPKVENPLTGVTGKASPLKSGNATGANAVCYASFPGVAGGGNNNAANVFTFSPPNNVLLEAGAWELTFVISRPDTGTQFELDPEFDVSNP
jgi:hypothetical protein